MPNLDPALQQSIVQLVKVLTRLNEESDTLNKRISDFEQTLIGLNPGIAVWCPNPLRLIQARESPNHAAASQVGYAKFDDQWGLWIRRGVFTRTADNAPWAAAHFPSETWKVVPLTDATREERAAAVKEFQTLVELMTAEAKNRLEMIERANKQGAR